MKAWSPHSPGQAVTLAIDDGPTDATEALLAALETAGHRAVLFVMGESFEDREDVLIDAVQRGFALGNHSFGHPYFSTLDLGAARAEIETTERLIDDIYARAAVERPGKWFRFPYLDTGGTNFAALQGLLKDLGFERPTALGHRLDADELSRVDWPTTVSTGDWALPAEDAFRALLRETRPGDIIEFHDKPETISGYLEAFLQELGALSLRGVVPAAEASTAPPVSTPAAPRLTGPPQATLSASTVISARTESWADDLSALWTHRDLLLMLVLRDVKLRYQHTAVGAAWALLQPLLIMLVLTGFASLVGVKTGDVPYPLFVMGGLVPWTYFTHAFTSTTNSLVAHAEIIGKIYFPRLLIPLSAVLAGAIDFFVAGLLLPLFMFAYGVGPSWALLAIPAFVGMALAAALALGLWLAVLNVRYRDVVNALPFVTQLMFFATPIAYSSQAIPEPWRTVAGLNPMVGVVDGFRWALLGDRAGGLHASIVVSLASIIILLIGGLAYFRRHEPTMADDI